MAITPVESVDTKILAVKFHRNLDKGVRFESHFKSLNN